jgi:hypothetical protein
MNFHEIWILGVGVKFMTILTGTLYEGIYVFLFLSELKYLLERKIFEAKAVGKNETDFLH